jgi:hypothetical protein
MLNNLLVAIVFEVVPYSKLFAPDRPGTRIRENPIIPYAGNLIISTYTPNQIKLLFLN